MSVIVPVAVPSAIPALLSFDSVTVNVSATSSMSSLVIGTVNVSLRSPATNVSVLEAVV